MFSETLRLVYSKDVASEETFLRTDFGCKLYNGLALVFYGSIASASIFMKVRKESNILGTFSSFQSVRERPLVNRYRYIRNYCRIPVLWIQIRKDPKLFAGFGSVTRGYGSGFGSETGLNLTY
jgi:hypothetical protein